MLERTAEGVRELLNHEALPIEDFYKVGLPRVGTLISHSAIGNLQSSMPPFL